MYGINILLDCRLQNNCSSWKRMHRIFTSRTCVKDIEENLFLRKSENLFILKLKSIGSYEGKRVT